MSFQILTQLSLSTVHYLIAFFKRLNQHLGLSTFYPNLGSNNPALFRVYYLFIFIFCQGCTLKNAGLF